MIRLLCLVGTFAGCLYAHTSNAAIYTYQFDGSLTFVAAAPFVAGDDFTMTVTWDSDTGFTQVPGNFTDAFEISVTIDQTDSLQFSSANDAFIDNFDPGSGTDKLSVIGYVEGASFFPGSTNFFGSYSFVLQDNDGLLLDNQALPTLIDFSLVDAATFHIGFDYFDVNNDFQMGSLSATLTDASLVSVIPLPAPLLLLLSAATSLLLLGRRAGLPNA